MHGRYVVKGIKAMEKLSGEIASVITPGVMLFVGELGAGKTTFVKGLAKHLGVKEEITSPTFNIVAEYTIEGRDKIKRLIHIDLYRLEKDVSSDLSVMDALIDCDNAIVVIEWADKLGQKEFDNSVSFLFEHGDNQDERVVTIKPVL